MARLQLNIGSGPKFKHIDGYVNIDMHPEADVVLDLENAILPYADGSVDAILSSHCFEHIRNLIPLVNECHRVLKPGGVLLIAVPHIPHMEAFSDPTHVRFFTTDSWRYFLKGDFLHDDVGAGYGIMPFSVMHQSTEGFQLLTKLTK